MGAAKHISIDSRFCGPSESGNGGYASGLLAGYVDGQAEVSLLKPPPLATTLEVVPAEDGGGVGLVDGDVVVAVAKVAVLEVTPPDAVSVEEARAGAENYLYPDPEDHVFPNCFVCGPARVPDDGLCLFTGSVPGRDLVAAPWTPHHSLADQSGEVRPEFVWSALDCPGAFAFDLGPDNAPAVLGRIAARIDRPLRAGADYAVVGWRIEHQGRKRFAGSAVYDDEGRVCAVAKATWIEIKLADFARA